MGQRDSKAETPKLISDPLAVAQLEAENAVRQFDTVLDLIDQVERDQRPFKLRVSIIQQLHRLAMEGLSAYAGNWRPGKVAIGLSKHKPPEAFLVSGLMEEMCDWINENWNEKSALELSAYVMWRLNWIHPFDDGNGRTSRAVSYLVLCAKAGTRLPGKVTIPELISRNKQPYYNALEKIDESELAGEIDLTPICELLDSCTAEQLSQAYKAVTGSSIDENGDRKFH
jgi:Fic family protein